jgi:peptide/nickel transport system substrate-binding protein
VRKYIISLILVVILTLIAGCGNNENRESKEESSEKVLNMAVFWLDASIEPTQGWNGWNLSRTGVGENLIQLDENMNFKGVIASEWEIVDETTTVFIIRESVTFHNGNPVDAQAVKNSILRALEITDREDIKFPLENIEADGLILTVKTAIPYATTLNNLADPVFTIIDTSVADDENFKYQPVATGPFMVAEFNPDVGMTLLKNQDHWSGNVGVDIINVKYIPDASVRAMTLQSGEIDFATQLNATDLKLFENNKDFKVYKGPNLRIFLLRFNMDKPYMKHLEFRQALAYGINKEVYARDLVNGIPAKGPFNDLLSFSYTGDDFYYYNPQKANELLDSLGFIDTSGDGIREYAGENIVLKYISRTGHGSDANTIGIAMQSQLKEIGIGMDVIQVEDFTDMINRGDYDIMWERWTSAPTGDPQYFLEASFKTGGVGNRGNYSNARLDATCEEFNTTLDKESRDLLGIEASAFIMQDLPAIFLYYQQGNVITNRRVGGIYRFVSEVYYIDERVYVE